MIDILHTLLYTLCKSLFIGTVPMKPTTLSHIKSDQSRGVAINFLGFFWGGGMLYNLIFWEAKPSFPTIGSNPGCSGHKERSDPGGRVGGIL